MSVRHALLALLSEGPKYGLQLRQEFEERTGDVWPLNVGQVYSTLNRLQRDGLVRGLGEDADGRPGYEVTEAGRAQVRDWFVTPRRAAGRPRDELAIKLALAVSQPDVDLAAVVQAQRTETVRLLQDLTHLKARADAGELAWLLVLDSLIFQAEAEARWLDACEGRLAAANRLGPAGAVPEGAGVEAPASPLRAGGRQ